ncbi:MAG: exopolyphosphatase [Proteobacteria bacterium]|nr:exopolyphosphatase [Pseudomonadota bacterium]
MRLLTRSDFDGLVCAVLLDIKNIVDEYKFVHPKDIQDGIIEVTKNDVLTNIPYVPGCGLWFDHHFSETERLDLEKIEFEGDLSDAASAAQVVWDYYGGRDTFGRELLPLLEAVNIFDSAQVIYDEIMEPEGWILLAYIMDARTGLGRFKDYRIGNYQLMMDLIKYCTTMTVEEIMQQPDVNERIKRYFNHQQLFQDMLNRCTKTKNNVIVTNLLDQETIYVGNRFVDYALNPDQNINVRVFWGKDKANVVFACGHSVLNRTSRTNVGKLMLKYGGGGHEAVGTCQVPIDQWEQTLKEIVETIVEDG